LYLLEIDIPTLIITAEKDIVVPSANSFEMHKTIQKSKLVLFKDAGHAVCIERYSDFDQKIVSFVSDVKSSKFDPLKARETL
jgi:pimeloyl-ACP methyl ester carboxylesterase